MSDQLQWMIHSVIVSIVVCITTMQRHRFLSISNKKVLSRTKVATRLLCSWLVDEGRPRHLAFRDASVEWHAEGPPTLHRPPLWRLSRIIWSQHVEQALYNNGQMLEQWQDQATVPGDLEQGHQPHLYAGFTSIFYVVLTHYLLLVFVLYHTITTPCPQAQIPAWVCWCIAYESRGN